MKLKDRVATRIGTVRRLRGLTQEALAEKIDRTADAISNLERGKSLPSFETIEKLAKALDVPVREFFDDENGRPGKLSTKRAALMAQLTDTARNLSDADLEIAVNQVQALGTRPAGRVTNSRQSPKR